MTASPEMNHAAIALNRFGLGARPDEPLPRDGKAWLLGQFERYEARPAAWAAQPTGAVLVTGYAQAQKELREATASTEPGARKKLREETQEHYRAALNARTVVALNTPAPFAERLVHFWANHFAVSIDKPQVAALAGAFEAEAIRPHVFGKFEDMLLAVERHPAMLLYLDQARSIGPESLAGQRSARNNPDRKRGLNENLAREILELHTLGVRTGYSQDDVTEFARALTGWTLGGVVGYPGQVMGPTPGAFAFQPVLHEPGARMVVGRRYEQHGEAQAAAIFHDLATSPATAQHIATKLARHFAGDAPPPAMVARLAATFERTGGDLPSVYRALVESPEAWSANAQPKFKTPWDWTLSAMRGLGWRDVGRQQLGVVLGQLGQPIWRPGSPAGYDDIAASWMAPDALMRRVEFAQRFAAETNGTLDARKLAPQLLPAGLSELTSTSISRAESPVTALALLLASPEFLRR